MTRSRDGIMATAAVVSELGTVGKKGKEADSRDPPVGDYTREKERSGVAGPTGPGACG